MSAYLETLKARAVIDAHEAQMALDFDDSFDFKQWFIEFDQENFDNYLQFTADQEEIDALLYQEAREYEMAQRFDHYASN